MTLMNKSNPTLNIFLLSISTLPPCTSLIPQTCPRSGWTGLHTDSWLPKLLVKSPSVIRAEEGDTVSLLAIFD